MSKALERRGCREPQRAQRITEIQTNPALSLGEKSAFDTQAVTRSSPQLQLSFLCVLCGTSVSSVFLLFFRMVGLG